MTEHNGQRHIFVPDYRDDLDARLQITDLRNACRTSLKSDSFPGIMKLHDKLMYYKKEILDAETDMNMQEIIKGLYLIASEYRMALKDQIMG